jgi:hypothetical protein
MTLALKTFMVNHPAIEMIEQKFSEPGHGNIQEVDAIHSKIERTLKVVEVYSPVSLMRNLNALSQRGNKKMKMIQMRKEHFFDFQVACKKLNFAQVPYSKVKRICITSKELFSVDYCTEFGQKSPVRAHLNRDLRQQKRASKAGYERERLPAVKPLTHVELLSDLKQKHLQSMFRFMPEVDRLFYKAILKL